MQITASCNRQEGQSTLVTCHSSLVTAFRMNLVSPIFRSGLLAIVAGAIFTTPLANSATATVSQTLNTQLAAIGKVSVPALVTLTSPGLFQPFTGSLTLNYRVRSTIGGGGSITVQSGTEFSPAGGPAVSGGVLAYTCSAASLGTPCSGTLTLSPGVASNVLIIPGAACTGGGGSCSTADPNIVNMNFLLLDDPSDATGTYSVPLIFTISST